MSILSQDFALEVAQKIVDESSADETEVTLESTEDRFVRFADAGPTQNADRDHYELAIRVRLTAGSDGIREAKATCGSYDLDDARRTLARAQKLAKVSPPNAELLPLAGAVEIVETAAARPTIDHTFREKAEAIGVALDACKQTELVPAGLIQTTAMSRALVNSCGRQVFGARSRAAFALTASPLSGEGGSGFAEGIAMNVEHLDVDGIVQRAVEKAVRNRDPQPLEAGDYTVVLEPQAVSSILLFAGYHGFGAQEFSEKSSFLNGRVGEDLFPHELALYDDPLNPVYGGYPFDGEGSPKQKTALLTDGKLSGPVTDARWAKKLGARNTGHGQSQPSAAGPSPGNLYLHPGTASIDELVAGVERGLLVTQFHYTNMIEPLDMTLTGMTRNGTFLIENGKVTHAVRNLRFTHSLIAALQGVTGIGNELEVAGALFDGEIVCPALRIDGFRFTSTTDF